MFEKIAIILVVNLILYYRTLRFKFVSDDFSTYMKPPKHKNQWHMRWLQFMGDTKRMSTAFVPIWKEGKFKMIRIPSEEQEHLLALILHVAVCILIYLAFGKSNVSFLAAVLYSVNPANNQGGIWPGGRGYVLPLLGLLIAITLPWVAPIGLFFCSSFTAGFLAPLVLIGSPLWYLLAIMPIIWLLHSKKFKTAIKSKHDTETFTEDRRFHLRKIVLAFKTFGFYFTFCIVPFRLTFYHNLLQSCAGNEIMRKRAYKLDGFFWIGFCAVTGWAFYAWHNWEPVAWGFLWFAIAIAPYCNLVRLNQEIAERFAYIANVGLMFALANVLVNYPIAITAFLVFYVTRAYYTLAMYKDEYWITEIAVAEDPKAWWAWHCRAMKRWDTKSYREALILWVMAHMISPKEFKLLINIATVLRLLKNDKEADHYLKLAGDNIIEGQEEMSYRFIKEHKDGKLPILL